MTQLPSYNNNGSSPNYHYIFCLMSEHIVKWCIDYSYRSRSLVKENIYIELICIFFMWFCLVRADSVFNVTVISRGLPRKHWRITHLNICSIRHKVHDLSLLLNNDNIIVIVAIKSFDSIHWNKITKKTWMKITLEQVHESKPLGTILGEQLTWSCHIKAEMGRAGVFIF